MAIPVLSDQDYGNSRRISNLPVSQQNGDPIVHQQLVAGFNPNLTLSSWTPGSAVSNSTAEITIGEFSVGGTGFQVFTQWEVDSGWFLAHSSGSSLQANFRARLGGTVVATNENNTTAISSTAELKSCLCRLRLTAISSTQIVFNLVLRVGQGVTVDNIDQGNSWDHTGTGVITVPDLNTARTLLLTFQGEVASSLTTLTPIFASLQEVKPSGSVSSSLFDNAYNHTGFRPASGSSIVTYGNIGLAVAGTATTPAIANTDSISRQDRQQLATAATAGSIAYQRTGYVYAKAGSIPGSGGYRFRCGFGLTQLQAGMRAQVGLLATAGNPTNVDPVTQSATKIAVAINVNTGNWQLVVSSGGAPTIVDLGVNFPVDNTTWYTWLLTCNPNSSTILSVITNTATGQQDSRTLSANLPPLATQLCPVHWVCNNATAAIASMVVGRWDLEFK